MSGEKRKGARAPKDLTAWVESHAALATVLLAVLCSAAVLALFLFVTFGDFAASADFVYTKF